ncbi:MAG: LysR substrate-binding domain-containing protein [Phyllobacterium sp.]
MPNAADKPPVNLDMDILRTFVEGVRMQSFAKAAKIRNKSPSAVSLQLQRLEQQVGSTLFRRNGRNLQPTDAGQTLFRFAEHILRLNDEAIRAANAWETTVKIRLGVPADLAETWIPKVVRDFETSHPGALIETRVDRNDALMENYAKGELDIAMYWQPSAHSDGPGRTIARFPIQWITSAQAATDIPLPLSLVVLHTPCLFRDAGTAALDDATLNSRIAFRSTSVTSLWSAVSAGLGITPRIAIDLPDGLCVAEDKNLPPLGVINLQLGTGEHLSHLAVAFAQALQESIRTAFPSI